MGENFLVRSRQSVLGRRKFESDDNFWGEEEVWKKIY
jgi:hypothetical protein